ncbi:NAD(P)H dehydrogenase [Aquaspirillum sp. LM1]|uniref:NAD(P)H-dependent oxidoreductase n=1 Tax=Aquaspirillum sp. LM1 TaxID=1938604 RepID=UPI0009840993|nr:NAD(P)H-dependent oxidoreductase [Aquaspirillum sp. LM1]AQR65848.1 NAD(P)H dehydrogenase [Aquaspirillum sp. LM1]
MHTKILLFHPNLAQSHANAAMARAAQSMPNVEVIDLYGLYANCPIDVPEEIDRLLSAERIVLQFPVQWYAPPALLKQWVDDVFTTMYYLSYPETGLRLENTPLLVAATAGNHAQAYTSSGQNFFALETLLQPLEALAYRCKLPWHPPFLTYRANKLDAGELDALGEEYRAYLELWQRTTPPR